MLSQETSSTANEHSKQSNAAPVSGNHSVPIWEVPESELKPFSNGDAAIKTTLKLLENAEWLVSFFVCRWEGASWSKLQSLLCSYKEQTQLMSLFRA